MKMVDGHGFVEILKLVDNNDFFNAFVKWEQIFPQNQNGAENLAIIRGRVSSGLGFNGSVLNGNKFSPKIRMEAEMKRNEMLLESQKRIVEAFVKGLAENNKLGSRFEENILQMKEQECAKLVSEGTHITPEMEYEIEKKVVKTVCAKHKTLLSGWEASSGPVLRKKDMHIFSAAETSRSTSKGEEDMESKYAALEEEVRINKEKVKQGDKKYEKLVQFMISKFPDSQNILCPPDKDGIPTHDDIADLSDDE